MFYGDLNRQLGISEGMFLKRGEGDSLQRQCLDVII